MPEAVQTGLAGLAVLVFLILIRVPIAWAMILVGGAGTALISGPQAVLSQLKTLAWGQFSIYDLSVLPMFILMGAIASRVGLSRTLFRAANAWFGRMRGGTAMAAIVACAGFGAVCGSSLATASTMGRVALPELRRYRYSGALATGTLAAGGVLGVLIPPSVVLIIYAIIVEANIVTMFKAAFIPGILAVAFFLLTISVYVWFRPDAGPKGEAVRGPEFIAATLGVIPVVAIFGIVLSGIYAGFFNPTPAASVGVFLVGTYGFIRGRLSRGVVASILRETASLSGMIYLILLGAELLRIFMSRAGVPQELASLVTGSDLGPYTVLIALLVLLILLGCLMDSLSMILLVVPFFWPVLVEINGGLFQPADGAGFGMSTADLKIWFGILCLIVVELGLITPPVGMNVFVISSLARDIPMISTFRGVMPFFCIELLRVALILIFPALTLWLPRFFSG